MIKTKLTLCGSLLYHWIQSRSKGDRTLTLDLENFQTWTGEFMEKSASMSEIRASVSKLRAMGLISVQGTEVKLKNNSNHGQIQLEPLPKFLLTHSKDNCSWFRSFVITFSLLVLWLGSLGFALKIVQTKSEEVIQTNPYQLLIERDK